jgi:hypothetical protein
MSIKQWLQERRDIALIKRPKPPRSLFKRYDNEKHWGLFIPVSRKKWLTNVWDISNDNCRPPAFYRMNLCITVKMIRVPAMRFREIRIRIGFQYL